MNEKLTMTLKWLSYVALFFCAVWFVFLCYQSYHQVFDTTGSHIHWEAKQNQVLFVSTVFLLYIALTLVVIGLCVAFFINLIKGIQYEELFPKKNIRLIFIASLKRTSGLSSLLLFYFSFKQLHQTISIRHSFLKALQQ